MTVIKENLKRIWDCLVTKAPEITSLLQPGLKREEIDEIIKDLPFKLPEELYELYQWRNGLSDDIGVYNWITNEITVNFTPLETAIKYIKKLIISGESFYFLIFFQPLKFVEVQSCQRGWKDKIQIHLVSLNLIF